MSTDSKKTENRKEGNKKIIPIRFPYDSSDDPEIDNFILKNLQEEADEIERRMNTDPEPVKTATPEEQYERIVARLKAMGEWEEDENNEAAEAEDESRAAEETETTAERNADPDEVYRMLSEEDRRALQLGRREQRRQERKKTRSARLLRFAKRGGVVAASFVLLFTVSMNVDASRRVILRMWDTVTDALVVRTATDNLEDSVESTVAENLAAMEEIEEATGIPGVMFAYWPKGMEYLQYEIQDSNTEALIFYSYGNSVLTLYMRNASVDSANYLVMDQDTVFVETLENWKGVDVHIWSVNPMEEAEQYQVEFEYGECRYVLYGYISLDELEELVKNIDFLS